MFDASAQFLYNFQFDSKSLFGRPVTVRSVKRRDRGKSLDRLVFVLQTDAFPSLFRSYVTSERKAVLFL